MLNPKHSPRGEGVFFENHSTLGFRITLGSAAVGVALILLGCGATDRASDPEPEFFIDSDALGEMYTNDELGISWSPPADWIVVSENQRQAVIDALSSRQDDDEYSLQVVDIFFNTENLSVAALSLPTERTGEAVGLSDYVEAYSKTIGVVPDRTSRDQAVPTKAEFAINDIIVTQFRHLESDLIVFTLIFASPTNTLVQLDYSIPTAAYQSEGAKLESSIGTLSSIE